MYFGQKESSEDIIEWVMRGVEFNSIPVDCNELGHKITRNELTAAYFGDVTTREFEEIYRDLINRPTVSEKFYFYHLRDADCAAKYGRTNDGLVLFRKFDGNHFPFTGTFEVTPIIDFLLDKSLPDLIHFKEDRLEAIFAQRKQSIFLFRNQADADS
jgi:hypothetical protein